jgi:hypothetical protein
MRHLAMSNANDLRYSAEYVATLLVEIERLRDAIFRHRERVWGEGKVGDPEDATLYKVLGDE